MDLLAPLANTEDVKRPGGSCPPDCVVIRGVGRKAERRRLRSWTDAPQVSFGLTH